MTAVGLILFMVSQPDVALVPLTPVVKISLSTPGENKVRLEVRNRSHSKVEILASGWYPNHSWQMRDKRGILVGLTSVGKAGASRFGTRSRDNNAAFRIDPGKSFAYESPPINSAFVLSPGSYWLQIEYHELTMGKSFDAKKARIPSSHCAPKLKLAARTGTEGLSVSDKLPSGEKGNTPGAQ